MRFAAIRISSTVPCRTASVEQLCYKKQMKDMIVMQEKEMRKESLWLIGFVILCCLMIIGLSSCSNDDVAEDDLSERALEI